MIRYIVAREFLDSLASLRFIISTVLCVLSIVSVLWVSTDDYADRLRDHDAAVKAYEKDSRPGDRPRLYRRPQPLGVFSEGVDRRVGNVVEIEMWEVPLRAGGYGRGSRETEYVASFASIDVAFVIKFILSLVAIFLTYDAISGERESGVLRLILSNSVSRSALLIGKLLGRLLCLLLPLVMGIMVSLLFLLINPAIELHKADWLRISLFFSAALLYISVFLCAGLAVSAAVRSSALSLIILLTLWVLAVAVHPVLSVIAAEYLYSIDHPWAMEKKMDSIREGYEERRKEIDAALERLKKERNRMSGIEYVESWQKQIAQLYTLWIERERASDEVRQGFVNAFAAQADFAKTLSRSSPAGCFSNAAEAIVNTDIETYDHFMESCRQFWHQYVVQREKQQKLLLRDREKAQEIEFPEEPELRYPLEESIQRAIPDIAIIILFTGLCFIAAYALFVRCEV